MRRLSPDMGASEKSWLLILTFLLGMAIDSRGQEPLIIANKFIETPVRHSSFSARAWTRADGLPQNIINSISQTPDGYMWFATMNGLARFDGARFVRYDSANTPELKSNRILHLYTDRKGRLWILSQFGDTACLEKGVFKAFGEADGIPPNGLRSIAEDGAGQIWVGSRFSEGAFVFKDGRFVQPAPKMGSELGTIYYMALDSDGALWGNHVLGVSGHGPLRLVHILPGEHMEPIVQFQKEEVVPLHLTGSRKMGLWVLSDVGALHFHNGKCDRIYAVESKGPSGLYGLRGEVGFIEDRRGDLWVAGRHVGLLRFDLQGAVQRIVFGETDDLRTVDSVFEDREGNIWAGLHGGGLRMLKARIFTTYDRDDGLTADEVRSVCEDREGSVFVATGNQIDRIRNGQVDAAFFTNSIKSTAHAIAPGADGELWAASYDAGLIRYADGRVKQFLSLVESEHRFFGPRAWGLFLKSDGQIYLGARDGLYFIDQENILRHKSPLTGLADYDVRAIAEDARGNFYLGLNKDGLLFGSGENWSRLTRTNGLPGNDVWSLHMDQAGSLWGGTLNGGLFRYKEGRAFSFTNAVWHMPRAVNAIIEDDSGHLWLTGEDGIFRVSKRDLNELADGGRRLPTVRQYGISDGLETTESIAGFQPAVWKGRDGRLWFAMTKGVSVVNPTNVAANSFRPPVWIEEMRVDDAPLRPAREDRIPRVTPGNRRVEIQYTANSFCVPEKVRFKYRLEGVDTDWTDAGARRTAYFQGLRPGPYQFRVIACNNDGVWNRSGATLAFVVQPFFWQTNFFRAILIVAFGAALIWAYRRRIAMVEKRQRAQEEFSRRLIESQELERKRMAAELHDSLGQKLQLIRNHAQLALDRVPAAGSLKEISGLTDAAITEVRAITAALRPTELDEIGLRGAIEWMIENVGKGSNFKILSEIDPIDGVLNPDQEMNLYRIVQETLNNIIKHAKASEVTVEIKRSEKELAVSIFDNGSGFDPENLPLKRGQRGFGLAGIGERVRILGGIHEIDSKIGMGTRLNVTIPLRGLKQNEKIGRS